MRLLILLLSAGLVFAQEKPEVMTPPSTPREAAIIPVKTLTGDSFNRLLSMLSVFGVPYKGDSELRTIVVYAPKETVDQMRHVVEQLDRPGSEAAIGRNIDMTITLLHCGSPIEKTDAVLSPEMESVVKQLRNVTNCKDPRVWDSVPFRVQEGKQSTSETRLPGVLAMGQHAVMSMRMQPEAVFRKDPERYVRFSNISINFKMPVSTGPTSYSYESMGINTSGDFREGQKTVLGKISGSGDDDTVFAVIALKVLD